MKKILLILFITIISCNIIEKNSNKITVEPALSRISVNGKFFVTETDKTIVFRGVNTGDPDKLDKDEHWNKAYFQEIKDWGATIVRFPVHPQAWRERGETEYIKLLDQGINWATELGLYVIIDWHSIGNLKDNKFFKPMYETSMEETKYFWKTMAQKYKDNNTVAFFEIFNEPTVIDGQLGSCTWDEWKDINEEIINIIRVNGCQTIPLVAGFNWGYDLSPIKENPVNAEGIGYVSHPYPQKREKPWEPQWTADWGFAAESYPIILSEMGYCGPDDIGAHIPVISDESYGDAITKYADERDISYTVWVFDPDWTPTMFNNWDFEPSRQGKYFKEVLQSYDK